MMKKAEPEVVVFEEPRYSRGKNGRSAVREKDMFLVSLSLNAECSLLAEIIETLYS
jgi:hypothetical protein